MHNICARFSPQRTIYAQDLRKIVLISPMRNKCDRFAQDCTYLPNAQYMSNICARLYLFSQCARFAQDCTLSPMGNICARLYFSPHCARSSQHLCTKHHHSTGHKIFYYSHSYFLIHTVLKKEKNQIRCDFFLITKNLFEMLR